MLHTAECKRRVQSAAFTLIELLIVVAIIAILAVIAVPDLLEAQTRSKSARAKADMRTIATALEAYAVDNNNYPPNDGCYNVPPIQITTPIAYLSNSLLVDVFSAKEWVALPCGPSELATYYTYTKVVSYNEAQLLTVTGALPPSEAVDAAFYNSGAFARYGKWRLVSNAPDRKYNQSSLPVQAWNPNSLLKGSDIPYDATNGTISFGNLLRTQIDPTMALP